MSRRLTLFVNSLRGGGAERVCVTLANELRAAGWDVHILVLNLRDAVFRDEVHPDLPIIDLGVEHARQSLWAVTRYIRRYRPEQFLVFNHQLAIVLIWVRGIGRQSFSIVARNISTLSRKAAMQTSPWHGYVVTALTFLFYRRVDLVIAQSRGMKQDLVSHFGVDERRIKVIHNPLASQFAQIGVGPVPWNARRHEILFVGRLHRVKGLELLIAACEICIKADPRVVLRLVGEGAERRALERLIEQAGIAQHVIFEGQVRNPLDFYAHAKLVALTSHYEGFPNVLLEALSQGTPVVSVDCASGPAEIVQPGVNGFLVPRRDARQFATSMQQALDRGWDTAAVRQTIGRFSATNVAQLYADVLSAAAGYRAPSDNVPVLRNGSI